MNHHHHRAGKNKKSCIKALTESEARMLAALIAEESVPDLSPGVRGRMALPVPQQFIEQVF